MGDEFLFFVLLGILYLVECHYLLHKHSVAFRAVAGGRFGIVLPSSNAGGRDRAIHLLPLFPPLRPVYLSHILPVSLSSRGILAYVSQTLTETGRPQQSGSVMEFREIRSVRAEEAELILNDTRFASCRGHEQALLIADAIDEIVKNPDRRPDNVLHELAFSVLDPERVRGIVAAHRIQSDDLRIVCNSVFILFFAVFPALTVWKGFGFSLLSTLGLHLVLMLFLGYFFLPLHRRYLPGGKGARAGSLVRFVLWPLSAIRANDLIAHGLLSRFHPAAVSLALCSQSDAAEFIRKILRDLRYPLSQDLDGELARSIEGDWRDLLIRVVKERASGMGMSEKELEGPPAISDPSIVSYCPRCLSQFSSTLADCPDCLGVSPASVKGPQGSGD